MYTYQVLGFFLLFPRTLRFFQIEKAAMALSSTCKESVDMYSELGKRLEEAIRGACSTVSNVSSGEYTSC